MDELKLLYNHIENPIDNPVKWAKLLNIYATCNDYNEFIKKISKKIENTEIDYDEGDRATFYLTMWSLWSNKLLAYNENELKEKVENHEFESNIYEIINYLRELDTIRSYEELLKTLENNKDINKEFNKVLENSDHNMTVCSDYNLRTSYNLNTIFTITVDPRDLYKLLKIYIQESISNEIPFYLKFNEDGKRAIVNIYTEIENTKKIENILSVLKKEYFSYFKENKGNILSGNIDEYIAIKNQEYYNEEEYINNRAKILYKSFDSVLYDYVINHLNIIVSYKGGRMNLIEYLSSYVMEKIVNKLIGNNIKTNEEYSYIANSEDLINLKNYIRNKLSASMQDIIKEKLYLKDEEETIKYQLNSQKTIDIEVNLIMSAIRNLTSTLMQKDNSLEKQFRIRIKNECQYYKIDQNKFCLDENFASKLFFDENKYNEIQGKLNEMQEEFKRFDELDKLINQEINDDIKERIQESMTCLMSKFEDKN